MRPTAHCALRTGSVWQADNARPSRDEAVVSFEHQAPSVAAPPAHPKPAPAEHSGPSRTRACRNPSCCAPVRPLFYPRCKHPSAHTSSVNTHAGGSAAAVRARACAAVAVTVARACSRQPYPIAVQRAAAPTCGITSVRGRPDGQPRRASHARRAAVRRHECAHVPQPTRGSGASARTVQVW